MPTIQYFGKGVTPAATATATAAAASFPNDSILTSYKTLISQ